MSLRHTRFSTPVSLLTLALVGCQAGVSDGIFSGGGSGGGGTGKTSAETTTAEASSGDAVSTAAQFMSGATSGGGPTTCINDQNVDDDGDGYTEADGDCNDCDANANPGAIEVKITDPDPMTGMVPEPADEDCDMMIDNVPAPCDANIAVDEADPTTALKSVELCKVAAPSDPKSWGIVSAKWVYPDGTTPTSPNFDIGHGILSKFGSNVATQKGFRMLGLSSGGARDPHQSMGKGYTTGQPMGFPKESPSCPGVTTGTPNDGAGLEFAVRAPTNATGFSFQFKFYTFEWPVYICSQYNDFFVAMLSPIPQGQTDGNISFDSVGNPVSVNNAFLDVCTCAGGPPCTAGGKTFPCTAGAMDLAATGFETHAGTSWLQTNAPVKGGDTITLRWATYDSGDGALDSTTLIDNFQWIANGGTVVVGTNPVPQ